MKIVNISYDGESGVPVIREPASVESLQTDNRQR